MFSFIPYEIARASVISTLSITVMIVNSVNSDDRIV